MGRLTETAAAKWRDAAGLWEEAAEAEARCEGST